MNNIKTKNKIEMKLSEYQKLASRTCVDLGKDLNDLHMKLGVMTELGELVDPIKKNIAYSKPIDIVNVSEEIADAAWYIANEATFEGKELRDDYMGFNVTVIDSLASLGDVVSSCEDLLGYYIGVYKDNEYLQIHEFRLYLLKEIAEYFEIDFEKALSNNIDKLSIRYPDKFENSKAINRNLDKERKELEK